jgi:predicted ArsR family transcriptional regulator
MRAGRTWGAFLAERPAPFLELAEGYDQVVCAIHLGLMQGALTGLGAPVTATRLEPFAEPGACLAHLQPVPAEPASLEPASIEPAHLPPALVEDAR